MLHCFMDHCVMDHRMSDHCVMDHCFRNHCFVDHFLLRICLVDNVLTKFFGYLRTYILYYTHIDLIELRAIQTLFSICEPYSLLLIIVLYFIFILIFWKKIIRDTIDILTGDVLGVKAKSFIVKFLEKLLPGSLLDKILVRYRSYYLSLIRYRP